MACAATINDATRLALGALVDREERRTGSRDLAFESVGQTVGASASWVKKFVSKSAEVKEPRITLFLNIKAAYEKVCARVEQEHRLEEARAAALRVQLNASVEGFVEMVDGAARAQATRAPAPSRAR